MRPPWRHEQRPHLRLPTADSGRLQEGVASCEPPSCTPPATSASRTSPTPSSSIRPTRSCASPAPASAAAISGPTPRWSSRRPASRWATRRSASSRTSASQVTHDQDGRRRRHAVRLLRRHLRLLPRGPAHRLRARRLLRQHRHQRRRRPRRCASRYADGTLFPLPVGEDDALMPSLLTLSDVLGTGHHAAVVAERRARQDASRSSATAPSACAA